jgi:subtilisin family serine protease
MTPRVVVVDSGIDGGHPALRGHAVVAGPRFEAHGASAPASPGDLLGHGTAVAATIAGFVPPGCRVEFVALRVFDREPVCDFTVVLHALRHAVALEPLAINLSLGTTSLRHREALRAVVAAAAAGGVRIVAPASYGGLACDPGNLPGVEAVVADPNVLPRAPLLRPHAGRLLWYASPLPAADAAGIRRLAARGESLAVAAVTGLLVQRALVR